MLERMANVELIVINSGVGLQERKLDWQTQREMIDVNIRGFSAMTVLSMNYFLQRGSGHLVGISSVAAHISGGHRKYAQQLMICPLNDRCPAVKNNSLTVPS